MDTLIEGAWDISVHRWISLVTLPDRGTLDMHVVYRSLVILVVTFTDPMLEKFKMELYEQQHGQMLGREL